MLRFIYRGVLRAHPSWFRRRFADEMLSIFDQTQGPLAAARLLGDGIVSLLRQWTLRPEFWEEPTVPATPNGAPLFHTFESSKPRTEALLYGAFLSVLVLNGVCWTMGYAWNHPTFVWIQQPVISPPEAWKSKSAGQAAPTAEGDESLYTDRGRVVLVFKSHAPSSAAPAASTFQGNTISPQRNVDTSGSAQAVPVVDAQTLQSYAGTYVDESGNDPGISISVREGRLQLEVPGLGGSPLAAMSRTKFVAVALPDCWIDFSTNGGYIRGVQLNCSNSSRFLRREAAPLEF